MYDNAEQMTSQFYGPLVKVWLERMRQAENAKERFNKVGKVCNDFYESQRGFMWQNKDYFMGKLPRPRFAITIAKAYEFVSIYAPHLYWQNANRKVFSQNSLELIPELFGDPRDQQAQQLGQQVMLEEANRKAITDFGNDMMSIYLNWSQREQPGSLVTHGQNGIIEALIKGMGLLWPKTYSFPGSPSVFTKLEQGSVDHLLVDPDCRDSLWETAGFIMCKHKTPIWQVERMFNLPRGTLEGRGSHASAELRARQESNQQDKDPKIFDCVEWIEIWSKVGVGPRSSQLQHHMIDEFDRTVGDHAYLAIVPGLPYPLNAPPDKFYGAQAANPEKVKAMFDWRCHGFGDRFPAYRDNRWPVQPLFFNPIPGSPYPLAPLAPGLGELIAINVITSSYVDSAWSNRQQVLAYVQSAVDEVKEVLDSDEAIAKVPLNDNIRGHISEALQFLNKPNANTDQLQALEMLSENFNRRVGLNEMQYGESKTQIRVSGDVRAKQEALSIRPQKMAGDVAKWLSNGSQMEMMLAAMHVRGVDLTHLMGQWGSQQWDAIFGRMDIDQLMRECRASVEASEVARPNKERDTANMQAMQQYLLPLLQQFAQETGDTGPLNDFLARLGDAMEMSEAPTQLPEWKPPVDEQQQQIQQQMQQLELQKLQSENAAKQAAAQKSQADAGKVQVDTQKSMVDTGKSHAETQKIATDTAIAIQEHQIPNRILGELTHQTDLRHKEEAHLQQLEHAEQDQIQDIFHTEAKNKLERSKAKTLSNSPAGK